MSAVFQAEVRPTARFAKDLCMFCRRPRFAASAEGGVPTVKPVGVPSPWLARFLLWFYGYALVCFEWSALGSRGLQGFQ